MLPSGQQSRTLSATENTRVRVKRCGTGIGLPRSRVPRHRDHSAQCAAVPAVLIRDIPSPLLSYLEWTVLGTPVESLGSGWPE